MLVNAGTSSGRRTERRGRSRNGEEVAMRDSRVGAHAESEPPAGHKPLPAGERDRGAVGFGPPRLAELATQRPRRVLTARGLLVLLSVGLVAAFLNSGI